MTRYSILGLLLLTASCETTAFTLPLPFGSIIIPLEDVGTCGMEHEKVHQEQINRLGWKGFLVAISLEYVLEGKMCGPLEQEAYQAELNCWLKERGLDSPKDAATWLKCN